MEAEEKPTAAARNRGYLQAYRAGDREAGERFVMENRPLVYHIAARFHGRAELSDLVECGTLGLVKAMNSFDLSRGLAFSTYAVPLIFGEIRRFLRDDGILKVSREEKKLCAGLAAERERRLAEGEDATIGEIAKAVGIPAQDAAAILFALTPPRSLDEVAFDDGSPLTLGGTVSDEEEGERTFDKLALRMAIEGLPPDERKLIALRYYKDLSQAEVARILGVTQVKVSRDEKKILEKLRGKL